MTGDPTTVRDATGMTTHAFTASGAFTSSGDVAWTSADPYLSGNFKPVGREIIDEDLVVTAGAIPPDLSGVYMRNGPNPLFQPISFCYPMDGDGMVHAVTIDSGRARYRNRFVETNSLKVERRVGHAVYGSFTAPHPVDPAILQPGDNPGPMKNGAFINVIRHAGHLLALNEATTCYELTPDLETIGEWTAGTDKPIRLGAHNRHHPETGSMFSLAYTWRSPEVLIHEIDVTGHLRRTMTLNLPAPTMIHDFILTERYIVIVAGPAVFDIDAARAGRSLLQWKPSLGMRIALLPLDGSPEIWIETDAFFVFHFANGFDRGGNIVIDYVHHESFDVEHPSNKATTFRRMVIDVARRQVSRDEFAGFDVEFPRVNDRLEARATRFAYMPTLSDSFTIPDQPPAVFNTMLKFDTERGEFRRHDFGNRIIGEAAFVPAPGKHGEDQGYLAVFAYDPQDRHSDFILLDAAHIEEEPVAVIRLPQRVPQGLHGNWIAST